MTPTAIRPAPEPPDPDLWRQQAACLGMETEIFFTERGESTSMAKAICAGCPVAAECLEVALVCGEKFGIWGGKSEKERRAMRRKRRLGLAVAA